MISSIIPQVIANSIIAGSIYLILALGFNLIFTTARFFDVGVGAMTAIGGYAVFFLLHQNLGLIPSAIIAVLFAGVLGFLINKTVYKKLRQKKATSLVMLVASLGVLTLLQAVIAMIFSSQFRSLNPENVKIFQFASISITQTQLWIIALAVILPIVLLSFLKFTSLGKAIKAISDDEEVAKIVGIDTEKVIGFVFFIGSAIAAIAGICVGLDIGLEPTMGFSLLLGAIIASIIGGVGNIAGGVLGAYLLGFVENFGILYIGSEWKATIAYSLLIIFLLLRPQGILKR